MFPGRAIPHTTALVVTPVRQQTKAFVSFPHDAQYEYVYLMVPSCCRATPSFLTDNYIGTRGTLEFMHSQIQTEPG